MDDHSEGTQINVRCPTELRDRFKRATNREGSTMNAVIERLMDAYCASHEARGHIHLDGRICPLSELINGLTDHVRANLEGPPPDFSKLAKILDEPTGFRPGESRRDDSARQK